MTVLDRFLKYVTFDTQSNEETGTTPSTPGQRVFAEALVKELEAIGMEEISLDENSYVMATLPANTDEKIPTIGFIAHLDTSPDMSGKNVQPRIVTYLGGDIVLDAEENVVLSQSMFPELSDYKGQDIIVTNGKTLLGADDKGGVAAIVASMQYLKDHPEIKHGKIRIAFTPDEEIGQGADHFDVEKFGCDWGYTIDGGQIGELEYENFNAASARIEVQGRNIHPGYAKDKMINALQVVNELNNLLPPCQRPEHTEGYEGFYHLISIRGEVENASSEYIIRDHSRVKFEEKKRYLQAATALLTGKYGEGVIKLTLKDQYYNMREMVEPYPEVIDKAFQAMEKAGVTPIVRPIRGGTDGARLSYMGLPCPNLFTGGMNFHGKYEYCCVQSMEKIVDILISLVQMDYK